MKNWDLENEDWYNITGEQINTNGGGGLLSFYYKGSPQEFVMDVFPDYDWEPWNFRAFHKDIGKYSIIKNIGQNI